MIIINGKKYNGNNLTIKGDQVYIDGKLAEDYEDGKNIYITVDGNVDNLEVDNCNDLKITGDAGYVTSKNGNIDIGGNVAGDVINKNGNIKCGNVGGDVENKNGNVRHN